MGGVIILGFLVIVVGIPVLASIGLAVYSRMLHHRQLQLLLEERKLLIEKGVTELPPLEMPEPAAMPKKRDRLRNLKAGIILLFIATAFLAMHLLMPTVDNLQIPLILGAIGVALLLIHVISEAYERRERQEQEPPE